MADKETGLFIPVSAYADKDSAKSAINELTKGILSSLKDGYIEVPAEIKASYARGSKELDKAQKDVIKLYEKMSKEGFSSSVDDLDDLIEKYRKFKSLAGKEGKGNSKQTKWLSKTIGDTLQPYLAQKRELEKIVAGFEDSINKLEKSVKKPTKKVKSQYVPSDEEITSDIAKHKKRQEKGLSGITKKLDTKSPSMDPGNTNDFELQNSERSSYRSNLVRQQHLSEKEYYKDPKHKATTQKVSEEEINAAVENAIYNGKNQNKITNTEKAGQLSDIVLKQLAKTLGGIEAERPDVVPDDFFKTLETIFKLDQIAGRKTFDSVRKSVDMVFHKYFNVKGNIGGTDGTDKTEGTRKPQVEKILKDFLKELGKFEKSVNKEIADTEKAITSNKKSKGDNTLLNKVIAGVEETAKQTAQLEKDSSRQERTLNTSLTQDIRESSREGAADTAEGQINRDELAVETASLETAQSDASTGFNDDAKADLLIKTVQDVGETIGKSGTNEPSEAESTALSPYVLKDGLFQKTEVEDKTGYTGKKRRIIPTEQQEKKTYQDAQYKRTVNAIEEERAQLERGEHESQQRTFMQSSEVKTFAKGILGSMQKAFEQFKKPTEVDRIMAMNAEERAMARAKRLETFGENRGRNLTDTGDKAGVRRIKELFGHKNGISNKELFQDVKLTPGFTGENAIDTTAIMKSLNKVLSGPEMFKAQTGGTLRNIIGSMTGYIGMDSIEKSRAEAEGLNQVMANVRKEVLKLIQDVQSKEMALSGMQKMGTAKFDKDGVVTHDSSSIAKKTFYDLEEQKGVLKEALAEVQMIDQVVDASGGKVKKILQNIGFLMPELKEQNTIIQNINAGLDKNGKALKFQKRTAEVLNYSFQLMSRHIGQMVKNWMLQLNPINLIKKAFQDFASYDPKWQRTMNVIKYNLRSIILPLMQKIAQLIVNIIGVIDIALQKVQSAFGKTPISLFDQENAKQFKDQVEEIKNVTAGFDELHDIGGDTEKDPNDLTGEIYKPQLSEGWKKFGETLGNIFTAIAKAIQWCIDNWKLLVGLLAAYVVGKGLLNLLTWGKNFGSLLGGLSLSSLISSIGIAIGAALTLYGIFQDIKLAQEWDQMTPEQRTKTANKGDTSMGLGGGLIGAGAGWKLGGSALGAKLGLTAASGMAAGATFVGGIALGISGTANAITAATNGNFDMVQKESTKAGAGIGMAAGTAVGVGMAAAGTKIGAALGAWAGPVGAAVGAVVGAGIGWVTGKVVTYFGDVGGEFSKLKISQEDLTWATEQYNTALGNEYVALQDLTGMEQALGQSGADLYKQVENGTVKYSELSTEQKILLKAYEDYQDCLKTTADALKQQVDYENAILMTKAEESGDYSEFIASMQDATNKGIYSSEEMRDRLSQVYAELSSKEREVFLTQIPEDMRQGVEAGAYQYYSGWEKFKVNMATGWENFKTGAAQLWEDVKTTAGEKWEGIKTTCGNIWEGMKTTAGNIWEGMKTTAGNIWNSIKIEAGEAWEGIKNSAVGQKVQEMATNVATKWNEMKTKASETWNNIKTTAGQKWEEIKNSAIGQKVQETWKNVTTKFNEIKNTLTTSWNTLKTNASTAWNNIKGSIVDAAKNAWEGAKGFFNKIADGVKKAWDSLKELARETGQKIGNFVSGNGWKTDAEIASYAVGTNYVPSDGLAYLHKGEAVIPAKYNEGMSTQGKAYQQNTAASQELLHAIAKLEMMLEKGINVQGQFVQRGSDLVATVEKASNKLSNNILNNRVFAR
jgi:hypothetical protein